MSDEKADKFFAVVMQADELNPSQICAKLVHALPEVDWESAARRYFAEEDHLLSLVLPAMEEARRELDFTGG